MRRPRSLADLSPDSGDMNIDRSARGFAIVAPHHVEQTLAADDRAAVEGKVLEEAVLHGVELHRRSAPRERLRRKIEHAIAESDGSAVVGTRDGRATAPDQSLDASEEYFSIERFGEEIIRAEFETGDDIDCARSSRQDENRDGVSRSSEIVADAVRFLSLKSAPGVGLRRC